MPHNKKAKVWQPARFTVGHDNGSYGGDPFAALILNQPLENHTLFFNCCYKAKFVVAADGGANRVLDISRKEMIGRPDQILNAICGDMDSIRPNVLNYFEANGVNVVKDPDQYSTDMTKCLKFIREKSNIALGKGSFQGFREEGTRLDIAIFGGLGGRADQAFSLLHHLYAESAQEPTALAGDLYLITPESVIVLLEKGLNKIEAPVKHGFFTENVGIIPIARPSVITTRGLEWDVAEWPTEFGTQISTSNHIKADIIEIETTERVLFTLELDV